MIAMIEGVMVFAAGLAWAARRREGIWRDLSSILLILAVLVGMESAFGLFIAFSSESIIAIAHRWFAHGLVIVVWCLMVGAVAAGIVSIRTRPAAALFASALVVIISALVILESFTGYLPQGKDAPEPVAAETRDRFYVVHGLVLPGLIMAVSAGGGLILRRVNRAFTTDDADRGAVRRVASENPYASPPGD